MSIKMLKIVYNLKQEYISNFGEFKLNDIKNLIDIINIFC